MRHIAALGLVGLLGCARAAPCADAGGAVDAAGTLSCAAVDEAGAAVAWLSGKPTDRAFLESWRVAWGDAAASDPSATGAAWTAWAAERAAADARPARARLAARGAATWRVLREDGPLAGAALAPVRSVIARRVAVWQVDDVERLVVTEADVEAWIHYASLCAEVRLGQALRLSLAERMTAYRAFSARFDAADRPVREALLSLGGAWPGVRERWRAAGYDAQQAWVAAAPLPDALPGTAIAWVEALLRDDPVRHLDALDAHLGPLQALDR